MSGKFLLRKLTKTYQNVKESKKNRQSRKS